MLDENRVDEILSEITESYVRKRNGGFNARCPVCGDSAKNKRLKRLHIDWYQKYEDWVVTCYNGGCPFRSGNIYSLYSTVTGTPYNESRKHIDQDTYNTEQIKARLSGSSKPPKQVIDDDIQTLDLDLDDCLSVYSQTTDRVHVRYLAALRNFICERHIDRTCFVAHSGRYKNRYIIPIYINGEMVYFQGRAMTPDLEPKYLNPVVDKSGIVKMMTNFHRDKYIIVTEGIIDSWMVEDGQGAPVLGAYMDDDMIEHLLKQTDTGVILCFDNPLIDESGRKVLLQFIEESKYKNKVKFFLPNTRNFKDLNDLKIGGCRHIYNYVVENSFSSLNIKVKLSFLYK